MATSKRRPWFHAGTGYWCSKIDGKRVYLARTEAAAVKELNRLLATGKADAASSQWLGAKLSALADEFLRDVKALRSERTHKDYQWSLEQAFGLTKAGGDRCLPEDLTVGDVRKMHLRQCEQAMTALNWSPTTVAKVLHAVQRVLSWAVEVELLDDSPLARYRKPRPRERSRVIQPAEFRAMLRASGAPFRRLLVALRGTGCRPGELRRVEWSHVDLEAGTVTLPDRRGPLTHKTASRQEQPRPRLIPLTGTALALFRWLWRTGPQAGRVFRNAYGKPWTESALSSRLRRCKAAAGIAEKAGESIVLYSTRHTYATEGVGRVSDLEMAELLGHTTTRTTRRYVHLNAERLRDIARRAGGTPADRPKKPAADGGGPAQRSA